MHTQRAAAGAGKGGGAP
ncbi:hypothetical protein YPPY94_3822, partial [Yersinia pestis PY-94]